MEVEPPGEPVGSRGPIQSGSAGDGGPTPCSLRSKDLRNIFTGSFFETQWQANVLPPVTPNSSSLPEFLQVGSICSPALPENILAGDARCR